jgi:NAD(P)-dependent dehydrogenase (short-subunit alcohol dehydrogenase family)
MAKAALNMMTRTSASDYVSCGIYMNSVDTGWITDENPHPRKIHIHEKTGFVPPLDSIDGMARILDPIIQGVSQGTEPLYGHFLKDYVPHPW